MANSAGEGPHGTGEEKNRMSSKLVIIRSGIVQFRGKISRNLLFESMVSHSYFLEDGDEIIIFDPSCGKKIAKAIEAHIRERRAKTAWKRAVVLAGHSHMDHANNFYLGDLLGAEETHTYVHWSGFGNGRVINEPYDQFVRAIEGWSEHYNPYRAYHAPYGLLTAPFAALHTLSPPLARTLFGTIGAIPWPRPRNGSVVPEPLRQDDLEIIDLGGLEVQGWTLGDKVILPTPGHSPCSISLHWPEKKALFVSDADYIGNPIFSSCSMSDCISSFETMKDLAEAGEVELLLPAHGLVKEGRAQILSYLDFQLGRLAVTRDEVLAGYRSTGENDVHKLTKVLIQESPLFRTLKLVNYPRLVVFGHNVVAVCLREEGILQ
jgi:glyoxylase-like metal-dependent hydrolase (beta-lactamase superfamily II)